MPYLIAFLLGSIPSGPIIARLKGVDLKSVGSGNIGATNVYRALGRSYGLLVFILDLLKGLTPMAIFLDPWIVPACVLGHCFSPWLIFRGGKGVSTFIGSMMPLFPLSLLFALVIWFIVHLTTRIVSLASIFLAILLPVLVYLLYSIDVLPIVLTALIVVIRHIDNINRLISGKESKTKFAI
ncbi:MAG TPA: glycerol-3-phosphate 1-O-acyltransferase PlsY [bacterium (Candidatus Stahlbacteria)]|nr:glycerol-3-phosphate 1-O-acyltransferase PlsY [Candidatus Stahlbacteria bacterium]